MAVNAPPASGLEYPAWMSTQPAYPECEARTPVAGRGAVPGPVARSPLVPGTASVCGVSGPAATCIPAGMRAGSKSSVTPPPDSDIHSQIISCSTLFAGRPWGSCSSDALSERCSTDAITW
jgi:hypothetical protein